MNTTHGSRNGFRLVSHASLALAALMLAGSIAAATAAEEKTGERAAKKSQAPTNPPALESEGWQSLFDGKTLKGWKVTDFAGAGEVRVEDGKILLEMGVMTGVTLTNPVPRMNYEVSLEAMRVDGSDFFCALTFPVGENPCSLIVGGWGGGVVGLSSLDGQDAANNETTRYLSFENRRWFLIRLRVTPTKILAWIDQEKVVDVETTGRKISIRTEVEQSKPFGIATWSTTGAIRNVKIRPM